jgi:hypothetical protein
MSESIEEIRGTLDKIDRDLASRNAWRRRFPPKDREAAVNLAELMNEAGSFSVNPESIKPELVAQVNFVLYKLGVIHPLNLEAFAAAILSIANDEDLVTQKRDFMRKLKEGD